MLTTQPMGQSNNELSSLNEIELQINLIGDKIKDSIDKAKDNRGKKVNSKGMNGLMKNDQGLYKRNIRHSGK